MDNTERVAAANASRANRAPDGVEEDEDGEERKSGGGGAAAAAAASSSSSAKGALDAGAMAKFVTASSFHDADIYFFKALVRTQMGKRARRARAEQ